MAEDIKKVPEEILDEELEQVAGGATREEIMESISLAKASGTCKFPQYNDKFWKG